MLVRRPCKSSVYLSPLAAATAFPRIPGHSIRTHLPPQLPLVRSLHPPWDTHVCYHENQGRGGSDTSGAPGGQQQQRRRQQQQQQQLGIREATKAKAESDLRDGRAREEEMSTGSTLKVAALWLVLISQLWLLLVLWNDPMGPASSAFLKD